MNYIKLITDMNARFEHLAAGVVASESLTDTEKAYLAELIESQRISEMEAIEFQARHFPNDDCTSTVPL